MEKLKELIKHFDDEILNTNVGANYEASGRKGKRVSVLDTDNLRAIELKVEDLYKVELTTIDYHSEDDKIKYSTSKDTFLYKTKEDAWKYFEEQLPLMVNYCTSHLDWDDKYVEFSISDYDRYNYLLYKWEGFDDDVEIGWEYDGKVFHSYNELWEAYPIFEGCYMYCDKPYIFSKDGKEHAKLVTYTKWENPEHFRPKGLSEKDNDLPF